ncbi:MAG: 4Fe-4S dicluster domain-containing protein [Chloroflexi bacterium]|nr:MAG: 4Fe-4S dicluster domain-containing protein [Chloroflexota bacterium]
MKVSGVTTSEFDIRKLASQPDLPDEVVDFDFFFDQVLEGYEKGSGPAELPAEVTVGRSIIPAGTGAYRDFSYIAPEIPEFDMNSCVGCMTCVNECPDTAILGKVVDDSVLREKLDAIEDPDERAFMEAQFAETTKFRKKFERSGEEPGMFGIFIDPSKCKGCAECVEACADLGYNALKMIKKEDNTVPIYEKSINFFRDLPPTPKRYISDRLPVDYMLSESAMLYVGGAGSCAGCGEASALRMMLASSGFQYGRESIGIVAATGCNTVYGSTYPYNPYLVAWINSLFENAPTTAMGVRARWDQLGWQDKKLWVIGGDGAMYDIGFQALSRMLSSGMDINVLVLDTQVYSNTGGQSSTASYTGQGAKMASIGKEVHGKQEKRKELSRIAMMHPNTYVAQTTAAHPNHFYRAIAEANEFEGPAVVSVYTTCQPEHGVADDMSRHQAKLAVDSRAWPLLIYDPRKGDTIRERLDLKGNPALRDDWYTIPKTGETIDFITFARSEGRFARNFDADGNPAEELLIAQADRLANWHLLQEMAGLR